jgi:predicted glycoside hydrolase/deacetylase ChbG (UPF0249 family)
MPDWDKKIIVSADDFGQSPGANKNILCLLSQKKLQRVSVMIEGKFSQEEINLLINSRVKIDLHLDFFSLLKNDPAGRKKTSAFGRLGAFFKDYLSGRISVPKIEKDWTQQLEKFRRIFGQYPEGLNSHEHIHFFPPYFKLISALAKKSKIKYLRFGKKNFVKTTNIVSLIIFFLIKINRRHFLASGLTSSDFLVSLDWLKKDYLKKINQLPPGEIELIVHPERAAEWEFIKTQKTSSF